MEYLPSPLEAPAAHGTEVKSGDAVERSPVLAAPLCALAFKVQCAVAAACTLPTYDSIAGAFAQVQADRMMGPLVFFRVYSGVLTARTALHNTTRGVTERPTRLHQMLADSPREMDSIPAGHIGVAVGLKETRTGVLWWRRVNTNKH